MLKKIISAFAVFFMIMGLVPSGVNAAGNDLPAPQGLAVGCEGTNLVITWHNPAIVVELAKSTYKNYIGIVNYIIDWRANGGEWHYCEEIPSGMQILDAYKNIPEQFCGMVYGNGDEIPTKSVINKTYTGIPYNIEVPEWLKTNNLEFRIRYIHGYLDEGGGEQINQHSSFSAGVLIGTTNPKGNAPSGPVLSGNIPEPPASIEAPKALVSEYMTLDLRWRVPESIKTLRDQKLYKVDAIIDWKLNGGKWNDGLKDYEAKGNLSFMRDGSDFSTDKDGYIHAYMDRAALEIPNNVSLRTWLSSRTYSFRIRYRLQSPGESGVGEVFSPYSNTVQLGRGTTAPAVPKLAAPSDLKTKVSTEFERKKIDFVWTVPSSVLLVNKKLCITTCLDYKVKGGKWLTERGGMKAAESTTGDLRDNFYITLDEGKTQGVISYRVFFACQYQPDKYTYSGFSNVITVDINSGKIIGVTAN